jgi:hypothetical protein
MREVYVFTAERTMQALEDGRNKGDLEERRFNNVIDMMPAIRERICKIHPGQRCRICKAVPVADLQKIEW